MGESMQLRSIALALSLVFMVGTALADDTPMATPPKGVWLSTDYPSMTVRAGEVNTVELKVLNSGMAPGRLELAVKGLPQGWHANIFGNGQPVDAVMPLPNQTIKLELRLDVPKGQTNGTQRFTVEAKGDKDTISLPMQVSLGTDLPAKLTIKPKVTSLRGSPSTSFEYEFNIKNDSGRAITVGLSADAPQTFRPSFTETYGSQQFSSIPMDAGANKDLKLKVELPSATNAGKYDLMVHAVSSDASVDMPLSLEVTGKSTIKINGKDGKVSSDAEAGKPSTIELSLTNEGTAAANDVEVSSTPPTGWKIDFDQKKIPRVEPNATIPVVATVTPADKAIAGDYMVSVRASGGGDSSSVDYRVAVNTSTIWGIVGIAIIAIALLVLLGAVGRFGRR
jgi:uncharacterized membrane protein